MAKRKKQRVQITIEVDVELIEPDRNVDLVKTIFKCKKGLAEIATEYLDGWVEDTLIVGNAKCTSVSIKI